uniref:Suppressor of RPS4-RLD 1 isoform X1 n=1 Tax=Rhizophora mucronata TaxID=61149 RepID=A0A2P2MBW5_RHIMU
MIAWDSYPTGASIVWQDWLLLKLPKKFQKHGVLCKLSGSIQIKAHQNMAREAGEELTYLARIEVVLVAVQAVLRRHQLHMALLKIDHQIVL